jgi:hypothetical protein
MEFARKLANASFTANPGKAFASIQVFLAFWPTEVDRTDPSVPIG